MSLRPEEIQRKAIAAGYGNNPDSTLSHEHLDDTEVLCKASVALDFGDWVRVSSGVDGYMICAKPNADGGGDWVGVVMHKVDSGAWVRVKTCGVGIAKVDDNTALTAGDTLEVVNGQVYARESHGGASCGRFLQAFSGDTKSAWVSIGGAKTKIAIHHHTNESNTEWVDTTDGTSDVLRKTGYSWNLFRVIEEGTGGTHRLALAIGGHNSHGIGTETEGWCWGGVIGDATALGIGKIGGPSTNNHQGVLGIERTLADTTYRVNIRSFAHFNALDRYTGLTRPEGIGPIRFSYPPHVPKWYVPTTADDTPPVIPTGALWWEGTMIYSATRAPGNGTGILKQWSPAVLAERNCQTVTGSFTAEVTCDDWPCGTVSNPLQAYTNLDDFIGSYENIIPYGYTACVGRHDELSGLVGFINHYRRSWAWLLCWMSIVDQTLHCLDQAGIALTLCVNATFGTKANGAGTAGACTWDSCCAALTPVVVPALNYGPASTGNCEDTACD